MSERHTYTKFSHVRVDCNVLISSNLLNMVENMIERDEDISAIGELKASGKYLNYVTPATVVHIFKKHTAEFFDGAVWDQPYTKITDIPDTIMEQVREQIRNTYQNCFEDCSAFLNSRQPDPILVRRTRSSLQYLIRKLEY